MRVRYSIVLAALLLPASVCGLSAEEPADSSSSDALPKKAEFNRQLAEWKDLLTELAILRTDYRQADDQQRIVIRNKWDSLVEDGDAREPRLVAAAEAAFIESPNADKQVTDVLVDALMGHIRAERYRVPSDNYEEALRLAKLLIDNNCPDKQVYGMAAIASLAVQDYDDAEQYFKLARENKVPMTSGLETLDGLIEDFLKDPARWKKAWAEEQEIRRAEAQANLPRVLLRTSKGDIELELFEDQAPNTVANFISLVEKKFYDGLTFHRVLPGFMAQGGDPQGDGYGGPGYYIPCECYPPQKYRLHFRGSLSMAHGGRDTGGSQFFITFVPTSHLNGKHTVFGRVISGMDVLAKLQRRDPEAATVPEPDSIIEAKVLRKRDHEYTPVTLPE
jgi:cyclophilin family peptidyl-prolyl cis-trans isomerase